MVKPLKAIGSIITVVVFLALAAIATVLYSGDQTQQVRMENNFFLRNTKLAMDYLFVGAQGIVDIGSGKEYSGLAASSTAEIETGANTNAWKKLGEDIKTEWENSDSVELGQVSEENISRFQEWKERIYQYLKIR